LACNGVCPVFYNESFETDHLDPAKDDFWVHFSSRTKEPMWADMKAYDIAMCDGYALHSVALNKSLKTFKNRVFIRIMYSTSKYDRLGN
jgi:hypothetical protein